VLLGLLAAHTVSRFWPLLVVRALPHVGDEGGSKSKPIAASIDRRGLLVAGAWCLPPLALLGAGLGVVPLVMGLGFSALGFLAMRRLFARRLQGFTGDCLGATQQVCEIAFYLGVAAGWGR
jgi:adenosylcobinamide-GDP ribazoletransferase